MKTGAKTARWDRLRLIAVVVPAIFLAAFHGALLLRRFTDASITRPLVLGRWAFAIALLAAAFIARRFFSGRRVAIVFWLIVAVLHLAAPPADRLFDAREDAALFVAAVPALLILGGHSKSSGDTTWSVSSGVAIDPIAFFPLPLATSAGDRAPPRF